MDLSPTDPVGTGTADEVEEKLLEPICTRDLPEPDAVGGADLPRQPPRNEPTPRGIIGAIVRTIQKVPSCVWVVNQHSEEITVVVSKYRPNRLLTGIGLNASVTGAGLNVETTTFLGPASKKTLSARDQDCEASMAVFPLWTRKEGFGVISIFKGPEKSLFIENDMIPLGATVYFANKPDLKVTKFRGGTLAGEE